MHVNAPDVVELVRQQTVHDWYEVNELSQITKLAEVNNSFVHYSCKGQSVKVL